MTAVEFTITTPYDAMLVMSELHRRTIDEVRLDREWRDAFRRRQELGRRAAKRVVRDARARAVEGWPHNHHGIELRLGTHGRERGAVIYQVASFCSLDWCNRPVEWPQRTYCARHKDPRKRRKPIGWMSQLEERGTRVAGSREGHEVLNPSLAELRQSRIALSKLLGALELPDSASEAARRTQRASQRRRKAAA